MRHRLAIALLLAVAAGTAWEVPAVASSPQLPSVVSPVPVTWTPNVSAGTVVGQSLCNTTFFGTAQSCQSEVYDTAYVNGDVVAVGAFTEVCQPGTLAQGLCQPGTQVTRDDIFAYHAGTGLIDPNFVPVLNSGPAWTVIPGPSGSNTVYVGGQFTSVNGTTRKGLVQLNVNPGVTSGPTADGSVVTAFKANVSNFVRTLALSPDGSALYLGGQFSTVNGVARTALARVNATTGVVDPAFNITLSNPIPTLPLKVGAMDLSANGNLLAIGGTALTVNGQSKPRLAIVATGGTLGATAQLADFTAPILNNNCSAEHDYVRSLSIAPDGSYLVIGTTGFKNDGTTPFSVCDAVARFNVSSLAAGTTGTAVPVAPAWINYAGGDSFYSVTIAGSVVYAGGHNRWADNYCGVNNVCEPNTVLEGGLSALDANTGMALAWWQPITLRGKGTMYLNTFPAGTYDGTNPGLALGTDTDVIHGAYHAENALFPLAPLTTVKPEGPIPSGMFNEEGGANTGTPMCVDDPGNSSTAGTQVDLATCLNIAQQVWTAPAAGTTGQITVNGLCLDTAAGGTTAGTNVVLNTCGTATTQHWSQGQGNTVINQGASTAQGTSMCLDDPNSNTTSGTPLDIAACSSAPISTNQVWPLPVAPGPPAGPPVGPVWPQELQKDTQVPCMDDNGNSTATGNKVQMWTCRGDTQQRWTMKPTGTIQIDGGFCLDSAGGATTSGTLVVLDPCSKGATSQIWTPGPSNSLKQQASGLCLADPAGNTVNGTQLQILACDGSNGQAWRIPGP